MACLNQTRQVNLVSMVRSAVGTYMGMPRKRSVMRSTVLFAVKVPAMLGQQLRTVKRHSRNAPILTMTHALFDW